MEPEELVKAGIRRKQTDRELDKDTRGGVWCESGDSVARSGATRLTTESRRMLQRVAVSESAWAMWALVPPAADGMQGSSRAEA